VSGDPAALAAHAVPGRADRTPVPQVIFVDGIGGRDSSGLPCSATSRGAATLDPRLLIDTRLAWRAGAVR
jgi:hypothetical protein